MVFIFCSFGDLQFECVYALHTWPYTSDQTLEMRESGAGRCFRLVSRGHAKLFIYITYNVQHACTHMIVLYLNIGRIQ